MTRPITKGELENQLSKALTQWEKEYLGRGSVLVKVDILRNMILVMMKGVLTPAEQMLSKSTDGMISVKKIRSDLVESGRDQLGDMIFQITGEQVTSFHTDISTKTGERMMVFILTDSLEKKWN